MAAELELPALEVDLPRLGGLRPLAEAMLAPYADQLDGKTVLLNARRMTVGTASYADGLISTLHDFGVEKVLLVGATSEFADLVAGSGKKNHLAVSVINSDAELPATRVIEGLQPA